MAQEEQSTARSTGKVSWFSDGKGYGFITPDDGSDELFVHQSSIVSDGFRSLTVGQFVEFAVAQGNDGKTKAVDVTAPGGGPLNKKDNSSRGNFGGRRNGGGGSGCFNCGEVGHIARECNNHGYDNDRGEGCFVCGELGHFARECRQNSGGDGGSACFSCGGYGHVARNCTGGTSGGTGRSGGACHECGETGHFARDCRRRGGSGSNKCFNCGKLGHFARECPVVS